ncbi:MAG: hypothetical protein GY758_01055 [Fuerstiella sp.]|nr:hypothetical protein [Fuerstiella sp.]
MSKRQRKKPDSDKKLLNLLEDYINRSENGPGSTLANNRDQATDYALGRIAGRGTEAGLSEQISGDVADMTDALLAEMSANLLGSDNICELEPDGDEDIIPARIESAVVNRVIMDQNPGFEILTSAVQGAALYKNGIVCVQAHTIDEPRSRYVGENISGEQKTIIEGETGGEIGKDGILTWTETKKRVQLRNVSPENWFTDNDYPGWSLQGTNFAAERIHYARGDLLELGYSWDQVKDIPHATILTSGNAEKGDITRRYASQNEQSRAQATIEQDLIETYWCYIRLAESGHKLRLYRVHMADNLILDKVPCDFIPYAVGKLIPFIGRFHGVSLHDRLKPVEDGKTAALRQMEDNLAYGNNEELILGPTADSDDAKHRIPGGFIRSGDPNDVVPMAHNDLTSPTMAYLQTMDKLRAERGGSSLDMQSGDSQLLRGQNQIGSMGVGLIMTAAEMRTAWMTRNFAETMLRQVFLLTHRTLRSYDVDPVGVWVAGQFAQVSSQMFKEREAVNVRGGMSSAERTRRIQALDYNINMQVQSAQVVGPGVLSDTRRLHQALTDRDKAAGIDNPGRYWLDPDSPQSQQAQQQNAEGQQAQQQAAQAMEQAEQQSKELDRQLKKYQGDQEIQWKYYDTNADNERTEAKLVADGINKQLERSNGAANSPADSDQADARSN